MRFSLNGHSQTASAESSELCSNCTAGGRQNRPIPFGKSFITRKQPLSVLGGALPPLAVTVGHSPLRALRPHKLSAVTYAHARPRFIGDACTGTTAAQKTTYCRKNRRRQKSKSPHGIATIQARTSRASVHRAFSMPGKQISAPCQNLFRSEVFPRRPAEVIPYKICPGATLKRFYSKTSPKSTR